MGIEPVHVPPANKVITPGTAMKTVQTDQYWRDKALEARARREFEEETRNIESIRNPQPAQDPPIKMSGSINLGNIDFQEQAKQAREAEQLARTKAEEEATRLRAENEKLKTDLLATTINNLQTNLGGQITKLQADLVAGRGNSKGIGDQLKEIIDSAAMLGYVRPDQQPKTPVVANATDAAISLEMLRLQLEDKRTERSFSWQMEKDRRQFQLELKKLDQANRLAIAESGSKKDRDAMILRAPEILGNAIAKGLISSRPESAGGVGHRVADRPVRRPAEQAISHMVSDAPPPISEEADNGFEPETHRKIEAGIGESGKVECPECGGTIAIGPTATKGICANCEYTVDVVRRGGQNDPSV
jgi:hypothetical protein